MRALTRRVALCVTASCLTGCFGWTDLDADRLEYLEAWEPQPLADDPVAISYAGGTLGGLMGSTREELEWVALSHLQELFPNSREQIPSLADGVTAVRVVTSTDTNLLGMFLADALLPIYLWNSAVSEAIVFAPSGEEVLRVASEVQGHSILVWYLPIPISFGAWWDTERQSILDCLGKLAEHGYWTEARDG